MLGQPGYGQLVEVLPSNADEKDKVRIELKAIYEQEDEETKRKILSITHHMSASDVAQRLGINSHLLARVTGTVCLGLTPTTEEQENLENCSGDEQLRQNVGLRIKGVIGFSKKIDNNWTYSMKTLEVLRGYMAEFPELFDYLSTHAKINDFTDRQVFGQDNIHRGKELEEYIAHLPTTGAEQRQVRIFVPLSSQNFLNLLFFFL